jgi:hypothetical protein
MSANTERRLLSNRLMSIASTKNQLYVVERCWL